MLQGRRAQRCAVRKFLLLKLQVDPAVSAAVHYVSSLYFKTERDFAEFYKSSLQYLAFVSSDELEHDFKLVGCSSMSCNVSSSCAAAASGTAATAPVHVA